MLISRVSPNETKKRKNPQYSFRHSAESIDSLVRRSIHNSHTPTLNSCTSPTNYNRTTWSEITLEKQSVVRRNTLPIIPLLHSTLMHSTHALRNHRLLVPSFYHVLTLRICPWMFPLGMEYIAVPAHHCTSLGNTPLKHTYTDTHIKELTVLIKTLRTVLASILLLIVSLS